MSKDSYYFSHDSNARNDIKMVKIRRALGLEGYGIYFCLIEILRDQKDFKLPLTSISDIAFELHTSEEKVKTIILAYDLFVIEEDTHFFSARLLRSMLELENKRQRFIDAGKKGGEASVKQRLSNASTDAQPLNKSKVNKSKSNEINNTNSLFGDVQPDLLLTELQMAWDRFVKMRKKLKKEVTSDAVSMLKTKIRELSKNDDQLAVKILNQSVENSWTGVFPLMTEKNKKDLIQKNSFDENYLNALKA